MIFEPGKLTERPDLSNKDHVFSAWLFKNGWDGDVKKELTGTKAISAYIKPNGDLICKVLYDNQKCTYRVFA